MSITSLPTYASLRFSSHKMGNLPVIPECEEEELDSEFDWKLEMSYHNINRKVVSPFHDEPEHPRESQSPPLSPDKRSLYTEYMNHRSNYDHDLEGDELFEVLARRTQNVEDSHPRKPCTLLAPIYPSPPYEAPSSTTRFQRAAFKREKLTHKS